MHATPEEDEDELALAAVAEVVAADPPLALDELDELLPHAVSTQLSTTNTPSARMGRHPITRISTSLGSLTHGRPTSAAEARAGTTRPYLEPSRLSSPIV
jgi:hypothetical protein